CTTTSVLPGWECQPVDEWGPNVYWATIVFVPGWTFSPIPVRIDPAPAITAVIEPLDGLASATVANPAETVITAAAVATMAHRIFFLLMVPLLPDLRCEKRGTTPVAPRLRTLPSSGADQPTLGGGITEGITGSRTFQSFRASSVLDRTSNL